MIGGLRQLWARQVMVARQGGLTGLRTFSAFTNHRNTTDNNEDTPFEFTKENYEEI